MNKKIEELMRQYFTFPYGEPTSKWRAEVKSLIGMDLEDYEQEALAPEPWTAPQNVHEVKITTNDGLSEVVKVEPGKKYDVTIGSSSQAPNAAPKFTVHSIHNIEDKVMFDGERFSISKEHFRLLEKPALELEALKARMREAKNMLEQTKLAQHKRPYVRHEALPFQTVNDITAETKLINEALALLLSDDQELEQNK